MSKSVAIVTGASQGIGPVSSLAGGANHFGNRRTQSHCSAVGSTQTSAGIPGTG